MQWEYLIIITYQWKYYRETWERNVIWNILLINQHYSWYCFSIGLSLSIVIFYYHLYEFSILYYLNCLYPILQISLFPVEWLLITWIQTNYYQIGSVTVILFFYPFYSYLSSLFTSIKMIRNTPNDWKNSISLLENYIRFYFHHYCYIKQKTSNKMGSYINYWFEMNYELKQFYNVFVIEWKELK